MKSFRLALTLYRKENKTGAAKFFLSLCLAFGIAALVSIEALSRRIENTVKRDSKNLLAADFQLQAWRPFTDKIWNFLAAEKARGDTVLVNDFLTTLFYGKESSSLVSARAIEGENYPFYGDFVTEPVVLPKDLAASPEIILDKSFRAKGVKIGDYVRLGEKRLRVRAFLIDDPQNIAGAFALGARVILPLKWAKETGLMGAGSRVFQQLLIRSSESSADFTKRFRNQVNDPHWRLVTPEKSNKQTERVLDRMRGFLSFVGLAGLFLGAIGLFMVFRSQFFLRLQTYLTLRCLGVTKSTLILLAMLNAAVVALYGWALGTALGLGLERIIIRLAQDKFALSLAPLNVIPSLLWGLLLSVICVGVAVLVPMREVLRVPVSQAIREDEAGRGKFSWSDMLFFLAAAALLIFLAGPQPKISGIFLAGIVLAAALLALFGFLLSRSLRFIRGGFSFEQAKLIYLRKIARSQLLVVSLGLALFFLLIVLLLGASLERQLDLSDRSEIPNVFAIGVDESLLGDLAKEIPNMQSVPVTQARIREVKGAAINEESVPEEGEERFFHTREYVITRRRELAPGESLVEGKTIFGEAKSGIVRVSAEKDFAEKLNLKVGDVLKIEIAGVSLVSEIRSVRKVKWLNFRPNFFLVFDEDDISAAPMERVVFARVPTARIADIQNRVAEKFPQVTLLDGQAIAARLLKILRQLSFAILSVTFFSLISCFFVFAGIFLARRPELFKEIGLWRCLGLPSRGILKIYLFESLLSGILGAFSALLASSAVVLAICHWALEIPMEAPSPLIVVATLVVSPFISVGASWLILRSSLKLSAHGLLRMAEESF